MIPVPARDSSIAGPGGSRVRRRRDGVTRPGPTGDRTGRGRYRPTPCEPGPVESDPIRGRDDHFRARYSVPHSPIHGTVRGELPAASAPDFSDNKVAPTSYCPRARITCP
eukprot:132693-Hanusia_phi.AAC.1